jgi:hypothetical protein
VDGRRLRLIPPAVGLAGLAAELAGTFLPWVRSGSATRNSYAAGGALRRLLSPPGALDALLAAWPALAVVCAAAVASWLLGGRVLAGALSGLAAVAGGAAALTTFGISGTSYAKPVLEGPAVTLIGATVVALAAVWPVVEIFRDREKRRRE